MTQLHITFRTDSSSARSSLFASLVLFFAVAGGKSFGQRIQPLPAPLYSTSLQRADGEELPDAPTEQTDRVSLAEIPQRFLFDELHLVQFPRFTNRSDLKWLLPLTGAAVVSFATDEKTMSDVVSSNPSFNQTSRNVSDGLRDGFIAAPLLMLGVGQWKHDNHAREAGLLGSEAMADAYVLGELVKVTSFRERPLTDRNEGSFYRLSAGTDSSFISGHSLVAWASAAVLASEYPGRWREAGIYALASGVSLTRVLGQQHFPSDALLGSAAGWLIGHYVYRVHHRTRPSTGTTQ